MDAYLGAIVMFAGNFAPKGWVMLQGQTLSISQHQALFTIIGASYGGDGVTTFALPDLRGKVAMGFGGGQPFAKPLGSETEALTVANLPAHNHTLKVTGTPATTTSPTLAYPAATSGDTDYATIGTGSMSAAFISTEGSGLPHPNVQPYLAINYIMPLSEGLYPSRN